MRNLSLPNSEAPAVQSRAGRQGPSEASREAAPLTGTAARSYAVSPTPTPIRGVGSKLIGWWLRQR